MVIATCEDCTWELREKNAQGVGIQHAARYGHVVKVVVTRNFVYDGSGRMKQQGPGFGPNKIEQEDEP